MSFKEAITPAASVGETGEGDCALELKLEEEEALLGVRGREDAGEVTEGGYQDCCDRASSGRG